MSMKLKFNYEKLLNLLKSFYVLTGVRIVIFDTSYKEIISYPPHNCRFCEIIQKDENGRKRCSKSNEESFLKCLKSDELNIYHCHSNLVEAMINLKIDGSIVGFIMFGQISDIKNKEQRNQCFKELNYMTNNVDELKKALSEIEYVEETRLKSMSTILLALAKYAISEKMLSIQKEKFLNEIDCFIDNNILNPKLNVNDIAKALHISRTLLYTKADKYLSMGVSEYVKFKRIEKAKEILKESDCSLVELTYLVGFNDYNYFTRVFKKYVGVSAGKYRKNIRTKLQ